MARAILGHYLQQVSVTLTASAFAETSALLGQAHSASEWQVRLQSDLSLVSSVESTSDLLSHAFTGLSVGTPYLFRVRYRGDAGVWSEWSPFVAFTPLGDYLFKSGASNTHTAAGGTFPQSPSYLQPYRIQRVFDTVVSKTPGREQRRSRWTTTKRYITLRYPALSATDIDILWDFYNSQKGILGVFTFVDPDSNNITCRFATDIVTKEIFETLLATVGLELLEVP